jgi:curli biogenesis system outer membrane secretion channel CsgG
MFAFNRPLASVRPAAVFVALIGLAGCAEVNMERFAPKEAPVMMGPPVRVNRTPYEAALSCIGRAIRETKTPRLAVAVGDVKDFTGKYSINEGNTVTQGGALMIYSALDKLGGAVRVVERFDTRIAEAELGYIDRRQLGDGRVHALDAEGRQRVPWMPYFGGSILRSDYYIVGGITELNQNISSGGVQVAVDLAGPRARTYTQSVAVDLRIVDTRTLSVVRSVSLQKQLTGVEVGVGVFRFFGSELFDINVGNKSQEPLQLGVRATLEEATLKLVAEVANVSYDQCLTGVEYTDPGVTAAKLNAALPQPQRVAGVHESEAPLPLTAPGQVVAERPPASVGSGPEAASAAVSRGSPPATEAVSPPVTEAAATAVSQPATEAAAASVSPPATEAVSPPVTEAAATAVSQPATEAAAASVSPPATDGSSRGQVAEEAMPVRERAGRRGRRASAGAEQQRAVPAAESVRPPAGQRMQGAETVPVLERTSAPEAAAPVPAAAEVPVPAAGLGFLIPENVGGLGVASRFELSFEHNSESISGSASDVLEQIIQASTRRRVDVVLLARISETNDPALRNRLANARIASLQRELSRRGVRTVQVQWLPSPMSAEIVPMHGGTILIGRITVAA